MDKRAYGTYEIARICDVTPSTVGNWIEKGLIPTFTTGGGHRRVWDLDLIKFLESHNIPVPDSLKNTSKFSVLVVDDEGHIRKLINRAIHKYFPSAETTDAVDGFEAGRKLATMIPALVILDLKLPGMDGFRVCELIRGDKRLKNTKILTISGHNIEEYRNRSISSGADEFLGKPFTVSDLVSKIKKFPGLKAA